METSSILKAFTLNPAYPQTGPVHLQLVGDGFRSIRSASVLNIGLRPLFPSSLQSQFEAITPLVLIPSSETSEEVLSAMASISKALSPMVMPDDRNIALWAGGETLSQVGISLSLFR